MTKMRRSGKVAGLRVVQGSKLAASIGHVWLVGAGPGDPDLLTVRALRLLERAEVLAYDELVPRAILDLAPPDAERIPVGRRARGCRHHEGRIHPLVLERALDGQQVVRLKGGDPYVFGRGGEEAEELAAAGIPFTVVPGVSAALGAAASFRLPLTYRGVSGAVTFATAHAAEAGDEALVLDGLPRGGTIVFYMGLARLAETTSALVARGWAASTPAAVVANATRPGERAVLGTLETVARLAAAERLEAPALLVVGESIGRAVPIVPAPRASEPRLAAASPLVAPALAEGAE